LSDGFNPYAQWLGLPAENAPQDHYELLGLERYESDPQRIAAAADKRLAQVRGFRPGPHARLWSQLLDELGAAKKCLLDAASKDEYDQRLREPGAGGQTRTMPATSIQDETTSEPLSDARMPPSPRKPAGTDRKVAVFPTATTRPAALGADDPMAPVELPAEWLDEAARAQFSGPLELPAAYPHSRPGTAAVATRGFTAVSPHLPEPAGVDGGESDPVWPEAADRSSAGNPMQAERGALSTAPDMFEEGSANDDPLEAAQARRPRSRRFDKLAATGVLLGLGLLAASIGAYVVGKFSDPKPAPAIAQKPKAGGANVAGAPAAGHRPAPRDASPDPTLAKPGQSEVPSTGQTDPSAAPPSGVATTGPDAVSDPDVAQQAPPAATAVQTNPASPPNPLPSSPLPSNPRAPSPLPPKPSPPPASDADKQFVFNQALADARAALAARKLDRAKSVLDKARSAARSDGDKARLKAMESLHALVEKFWFAVGEAMRGLEVAAELQVGGTVVSVVEVGRDSVSIRVAGTKHDYKQADMPGGLAHTLALRWFDEAAPETKLALGAFQAVDPNGDAAEAKRLWEEAALVGASIEELLPALQEGAQSPQAIRSPVPSDSALAAAGQAVEKTFSRELAAANSAAAKMQLAKKLIEVAEATTAPAERFALLRKAGQLASTSGNITLLVRVVDEIARAFEVEPLDAKADALSKANEIASPAVAKAIAHNSIKLLEQALLERRMAVAERLNRVTVAAAAKSGDALLMKQATKRNEQVQKLLGKEPR